MDVVEINGLRTRTEVGSSSNKLGNLQELDINIHLRTSTKKAGETDCVEDTISYEAITKEVLFRVENKKYNLIEAVATDVARICVVRHGVPSVKVTVLHFSKSFSVTIERRWEDFDWREAHIVLGSNKDPLHNISKAISLLKKKANVIKLSKAFWTTPVNMTGDSSSLAGDEVDDFVNMAAFVKTKLDVVGLKQALLDIESQLGRVHKGENTHSSTDVVIDLDISFYGNDVMEYVVDWAPGSKQRVVPHPETLKQAHVIIPLADVTPDFLHPQAKKSLKALAKEISGQEDITSFFSAVEDKDFLAMVCNDMQHAHKEVSCETQSNADDVLSEIDKNPASMINGIPLSSWMPLTNGVSLSNGISSSNGMPMSYGMSQDWINNRSGEKSLTNENLPSMTPQVALVTGAAKRLGACIARTLHASGYRVVIHYNKSKAEANNLLRQLNSIRSNSASVIQGDLTCDVSNTAQRIITEAVRVWGRLDVLVNNASQFYATQLGSVTEEVWEDLIRANLTSPFFISQAAYSFLKLSKGSIVNLCDIHAVRPKSNHSVYCISKAGLHMCTFSLAKEFAPEVRVNGVAPGCILWPEESWDGLSADERDRRQKVNAKKQEESISKVPFGRKGEPENVADAVLFLSKSAEYITGQIIAVDGGRSLHQ